MIYNAIGYITSNIAQLIPEDFSDKTTCGWGMTAAGSGSDEDGDHALKRMCSRVAPSHEGRPMGLPSLLYRNTLWGGTVGMK